MGSQHPSEIGILTRSSGFTRSVWRTSPRYNGLLPEPSMRISCTYRSKEKELGSSHSEVTIGRVEDRSGPSLDLTPGSAVSRLHARIWQANGCYWIEDFNTTDGTNWTVSRSNHRATKNFRRRTSSWLGQSLSQSIMIVYGGQIEAYRVNSFRPVVSD